MTVFISYRRSDSSDITDRIYERLVQQFGKDKIFRDVHSIKLGHDFRKDIDEALNNCQVLLVVIGRDWLTVTNQDKSRRLENPKDPVRVEIGLALEFGISVIPVLVGGAKMPSEEDLPPILKPLVFRHGIAVRSDPDFHGDMDQLNTAIKQEMVETVPGKIDIAEFYSNFDNKVIDLLHLTENSAKLEDIRCILSYLRQPYHALDEAKVVHNQCETLRQMIEILKQELNEKIPELTTISGDLKQKVLCMQRTQREKAGAIKEESDTWERLEKKLKNLKEEIRQIEKKKNQVIQKITSKGNSLIGLIEKEMESKEYRRDFEHPIVVQQNLDLNDDDFPTPEIPKCIRELPKHSKNLVRTFRSFHGKYNSLRFLWQSGDYQNIDTKLEEMLTANNETLMNADQFIIRAVPILSYCLYRVNEALKN